MIFCKVFYSAIWDPFFAAQPGFELGFIVLLEGDHFSQAV